MTGPDGWTPQYNGCPIKQPCDSTCPHCQYFKVGDKVISIGGAEVGRKGVLKRKTIWRDFQSFIVKWADGGDHDKFIQHYRLQYSENDIEFYKERS